MYSPVPHTSDRVQETAWSPGLSHTVVLLSVVNLHYISPHGRYGLSQVNNTVLLHNYRLFCLFCISFPIWIPVSIVHLSYYSLMLLELLFTCIIFNLYFPSLISLQVMNTFQCNLLLLLLLLHCMYLKTCKTYLQLDAHYRRKTRTAQAHAIHCSVAAKQNL